MPRSKPDGFSVNVRCLDDGAVRVTRITMFDGEHWEEAMAKLAGDREGSLTDDHARRKPGSGEGGHA